MARLIQAVVNAAPIHADIHVQINAGGNPPASGAAAAAASSGSGTAAAATTTASTGSNGGAGGPQPNPTMTNNTSTNTNSGGNDGTQSRFATVTLPTTSTQTRSTARPHVHSIPPAHIRQVRPIPANMLSSFDRFDRSHAQPRMNPRGFDFLRFFSFILGAGSSRATVITFARTVTAVRKRLRCAPRTIATAAAAERLRLPAVNQVRVSHCNLMIKLTKTKKNLSIFCSTPGIAGIVAVQPVWQSVHAGRL